jgi:hypothetical protein
MVLSGTRQPADPKAADRPPRPSPAISDSGATAPRRARRPGNCPEAFVLSTRGAAEVDEFYRLKPTLSSSGARDLADIFAQPEKYIPAISSTPVAVIRSEGYDSGA